MRNYEIYINSAAAERQRIAAFLYEHRNADLTGAAISYLRYLRAKHEKLPFRK